MHGSASQNQQQRHNRLIYLRSLGLTLSLTLLCSGIFLAARLVILFLYGPKNSEWIADEVWFALWTGLRFDIAVVMRVAALGILLNLICLAIPSTLPSKLAWLFNRSLGYCLLLLAVLLSIANITFISFFDRPIDSFFFKGLSYGTSTALQSVYGLEDFYSTLFAAILSLYATFSLYSKVSRSIVTKTKNSNTNTKTFAPLVIASLIILAVLGRGTLSTFPLSYRHLDVSGNSYINNIVPNGIIALYYGYRDFRKSKVILPADDKLGRQLFSSFYGREPTADSLFRQFFTTTKQSSFLQQQPPHVVLNILESMSQALLTERFNQGINLAGAMQKHFSEDIYFEKFLPASDGTQRSLVNLLFNIEYSDISLGIHQQVQLETSVARVFREAGYRTVFIYSGFEGEMNLSNYLKSQGFDEFIGSNQLKRLFPSMELSVWGGEDSYVFETAWKILSEHQEGEKPLFIVNLTITNHPPYRLPKNSTLSDLRIPQHLQARLQSLPLESLYTYVHTNDRLGQFVDRIKSSELHRKTIVAVTGDHAIRGMYYEPNEKLHQISVPFYLYVPSHYAPQGEPDTSQIGSHKDIMPTLYNLALSDVSYPNLGRNLLSPISSNSIHNFAYHTNYLLMDNVAYRNGDPNDLVGRRVSEDFDTTDEQVLSITPEVQRANEYSKILDWLTRYQLSEQEQ